MNHIKLTNTKIDQLPIPKIAQVFYWDTDVKGLAVRVTSAGSKSFIIQRRVNGKTRRFTVGPFGVFSCDEARKRAVMLSAQMYDGVDPLSERKKAAAQNVTLRDVMHDYLQNKKTKNGFLRPSTKKSLQNCIEFSFKDWLDRPIAEINRDMCIKRFKQRSKTAPTQINQSFRNLRALINYARELHAAEDGTYTILATNPVTQMFKGGLVQWNIEKPRTTRIPKNMIGAAWEVLQQHANPNYNNRITCTGADLICFMLLTGTRHGEAKRLKWADVKLNAPVPTFYLRETKNHNSIELPINSALLEVLKRRHTQRIKGNDYVFPAVSGKSGHISDPRTIIERISEAVETYVHFHALRRTFDDMAQLCGVDSDQRRQLLNHKANDIHGQAYSNNPDPESLLPAVEKIGKWVLEQQSAFIESKLPQQT